MSQIDKLRKKFYSKPVRNDMTYDEIIKLADYYNCKDISGGTHPIKIVDKESGTVIPIPRHGSCVKEAYIAQLRELFDTIEARRA